MFYYIRKEWKNNLITIILTIACIALQISINLLTMRSTQSIIDLNWSRFLVITVIETICWFLNFLFTGIGYHFQSKAIRFMNNAVRRDIAATMTAQKYEDFHKLDTGELISQFSNDIERIEHLAWLPFYTCIELVSGILLSIIALLTVHWTFLVAAAFNALLMLVVPKLFDKKMTALGSACTLEQAKGLSRIKDASEGFDVLNLFGKKARFIDGISDGSDGIEKSKFRLNSIKGFTSVGVDSVNLICQMLINVWLVILIFKGVVFPGAMLGTGNLIGRLSSSLGNLAACRLSITASKPYFDKITEHSYHQTEHAFMPILPVAMENISFHYGEKQVLNNVSMDVQKGGKYALTGPSGCGKSTLLKLLLGWLPDYSGTILFGSKNAKELNVEQTQRQISYIEQDVFLFNTTIRDNITLGDDFTDEQLMEAVKNSALSSDLKNMPDGLDTAVGENGSSLSGGQKQRVAIARALIHGCQILLVDEGTSALDQANADLVEENLLSNPDLTLILISHHLSEERKKRFTRVYELGNYA